MQFAWPYIALFVLYLLIYAECSKKRVIYRSRLRYKDIAIVEKKHEYLVIAIYLLFYGLRGYIFTDCFQYHNYFEEASWREDSIFETTSLFEPGYVLSNIIIYQFSDSPFFFQFVWTFIDVILLYIILKRETGMYCILAFAILIPFWDGVQMNLWRNIKSILIFCWAIKYIRNRCLWKYLLSIHLACFFHLTSLFFLPLYWFINKDNRTIYMIISIISVVLYIVGVESFFENIILIGILLGGKFDRISSGYIASAVDAGFTFGFCFRLFLMTLLLVCYPKLKKKNLIMLNMAFLFLCSNMAFNSVLVMRDRISILFSMGIVCIMPYLIAVLCHSKAKVFIVGLLFAFMFAQVYVQHNTPAAKYENILLGISDKARAKIRIFEESSKAVDR